MVFTVLWRKHSKAAAILSPILGLATGLAVWLGTASHFFGEVSVTTTGEILPCVYGTVASCFSPILYSVVITLIKPQNYDWADFKKEKLALEKLESNLTTVHHQESSVEHTTSSIEEGRVRSATFDAKELKRWGRIAAFWSIATFLGHWVIWPLPMYASHYVFEKKVSAKFCPRNLSNSLIRVVLHRVGRCGHYLAMGYHARCNFRPIAGRWDSANHSGLSWPHISSSYIRWHSP